MDTAPVQKTALPISRIDPEYDGVARPEGFLASHLNEMHLEGEETPERIKPHCTSIFIH